MKEPKYRNGTGLAMKSIARKLNLPFENWMQDWPIEVVDASNIDKYIDHYKTCIDDDEKFILMQAIIQATEEQPNEMKFSKYWQQVRPILIDDYGIHEYTIYYWSRFEAIDETECWKISEQMREVWHASNSNSSE